MSHNAYEGVNIMRNKQQINPAISSLFALLSMFVTVSSSHAAPPESSGSVWEVLEAKGLKGDHYTLNIHGKKSDFNKQDCTAEPDPITGEYGNNIFMPSYTGETLNHILVISGQGKGAKKDLIATYGVRDTCTDAFDGDAAEVVLPPNDKGYFVVARVLGRPTDNPELTLNNGQLMWVEDEAGNDLLILGLVTSNGWETPEINMTRTKGKVKAVDITGLFQWYGNVCYFDTTNYCSEETPCTDTTLCCIDSDLDGIKDDCTEPVLDEFSQLTCDVEGYSLTTLGCREYTGDWVFNIGDFVGVMWDTYADGDFKLANIRFYPVK